MRIQFALTQIRIKLDSSRIEPLQRVRTRTRLDSLLAMFMSCDVSATARWKPCKPVLLCTSASLVCHMPRLPQAQIRVLFVSTQASHTPCDWHHAQTQSSYDPFEFTFVSGLRWTQIQSGLQNWHAVHALNVVWMLIGVLVRTQL